MAKASTVEKDIYKRGPKSFQVKIRRNGVEASATFKTVSEARKWRDKQVGKIVGDDFVDRSKERRTCLQVILARYKSEITPHKKGARQEANRLDAWIKSDISVYSIVAVDQSDISTWVAGQVALGRAPSTISNSVNLLSAVFRKAREWGYKVENPCAGVARPAPRPPRFAVLTESEQKILLAACASGPTWLPIVVKLALSTGMRQGEIRRMRWNEIKPTHIHLPETKNGDKRDVILTAEGAAVISEMREHMEVRRLDGWVFGDPNLPSDQGGFTQNQISQAFRDAVDRAKKMGLDFHLTFHDLRHVSLTKLADYHDNIIDLSQTSGHKSLQVLKRYMNRTPEDSAKRLREREAAVKARAAAGV